MESYWQRHKIKNVLYNETLETRGLVEETKRRPGEGTDPKRRRVGNDEHQTTTKESIARTQEVRTKHTADSKKQNKTGSCFLQKFRPPDCRGKQKWIQYQRRQRRFLCVCETICRAQNRTPRRCWHSSKAWAIGTFVEHLVCRLCRAPS